MDLRLEPLPDDLPDEPPGAPATKARRFPVRIPARLRNSGSRLRDRLRRAPKPLLWSLALHVLAFLALWSFGALDGAEREDVAVEVGVEWSSFSTDRPEDEPGGRDTRSETPNAAVPQPVRQQGDSSGLAMSLAGEAVTAGTGASPQGSAWSSRGAGKEALLLAGGGDASTEGAVRAALAWLARHQCADGSWSADRFGDRCPAGTARCDGAGERSYAAATTALSLLAFLGAGHTHVEGEWQDTVRRGLEFLLREQREDGLWAADSKRAYASAFATLALCESAGMTGSPKIRAAAQRALDAWPAWQRHPSSAGGWRYEPGDGHSDSSITAWVLLAMSAGRRAGLDSPESCIRNGRTWFAYVRNADGTVGYSGPGTSTPALLGAALFSDAATGGDPSSRENAKILALLRAKLPRLPRDDRDPAGDWGAGDPMHWYYGSLAMFRTGGDDWDLWQMRLRATLLPSQETAEDRRGSWAPCGLTGRHGGRVVTTALAALCLEVYYRYPRAAFSGADGAVK